VIKDFVEALYAVDAEIRPLQDGDEFQQVVASVAAVAEQFPAEFTKDLSLAAPAPIIGGKPRMLHIAAMIVHEGTNRNGDKFLAEELSTAVNSSTLFADGYAGIIDIEHDFTPVGYWYKSEYTTDPKTGTRGILAHGAVWAYLFPEVTDKILAQQQREGFVRVSMACISKKEDVAFEVDETGRLIKTMHNPVFLGATILLDASAGDLNAIGVVDEDPVKTNESTRKGTVLKAASLGNNNNNNLEEKAMIDEIRPLLAELLGDQSGKFTDSISELIGTKIDGFKNLLDEKDVLITEANSKVDNLTSQLDDLNTTLAEKDLTLSGLKEEKVTLEAELETTKAALEVFESEKAAAAVEASKAARLNDLGDGVRVRLMAKPEEIREKLLIRWANLSDEEWETVKAELSLADSPPASQEPLPNPGNTEKKITDFLK